MIRAYARRAALAPGSMNEPVTRNSDPANSMSAQRTVGRRHCPLADGVRSRRNSSRLGFARARSLICCSEQAFSLGQLPNAFKRCECIAARLPKRRVENRSLTYDDPSLVAEPEGSRCFIFRGGFGEQHPGFRGALKFSLPLSLRRSWLFRVPSNSGHVIVCVRRDWRVPTPASRRDAMRAPIRRWR